MIDHFSSAQYWLESLENWQSKIPLHHGGGALDFPAFQRATRLEASRFSPQRDGWLTL